MRKIFVSLLLFLFIIPVFAENVRENITSNTTWSSGTYNIWPISGSSISITSGATLTIEPGVTVEFNGDYDIIITGGCTLDADSVTFTSNSGTPSAGDWGSIKFLGNSTNDAIGIIDSCVFEYGGNLETDPSDPSGPIVLEAYSNVIIDSCTIKDCLGSAIGVCENEDGNNAISVTNNLIYNCNKGINIQDKDMDYIVTDTLFVRNNIIFNMENNSQTDDGTGILLSLCTANEDNDYIVSIRNNLIYKCYSDGINIWADSSYIWNNTINLGTDGIKSVISIGL